MLVHRRLEKAGIAASDAVGEDFVRKFYKWRSIQKKGIEMHNRQNSIV